MAYFFDEGLPSTSSAFVEFIPGLEEEREMEDSSPVDASHSSNMDQSSGQPSSFEQINHKVEELVKTINLRRANDQEFMASFQEKLSDKMAEKFRELSNILVTVYEINSARLQEKMDELKEVLNNCERLNQELLEATQALSHLRDSF